MKRKWLGLALAAAMACAGTAWADILAQDSAANYSDEYPFVKDSNGGSGFAGWEFPDAVPALADSAAGACGDINSANGLSFRVARDGSTDWCHIYRGFETLNPGDTMTLKFTCAWDGGGRGIDLFAGGEQIANAVNLGPGNNLSVNGVTVSEEYAGKSVSTLVLAQEADGITIALARVPAEEGGEGNVAYFTKVETDKKLSRIGFYAGGWDWADGANVDNYALFVNDLKIEGTPPADKLSLSAPDGDAWKVLSATETLEFTVSRTGTEGDLDVALASSFPEFVSVPDGVTIADGATSATFPVKVALQGYGNEASISATATDVTGANYGLKGPQYKMSAQNDGKVDPETESNFWVNWIENGVRDDSKLTLDVEPEGALTVTDPSTWTWIDEEGGAYVASQFTAHESGKMILKFDGVELWSQDISLVEAGATLSGPTSIRVGVPTTYTLDVTLPSGMTDSLGLEAEGTAKVIIEPDTARELEASGTLEFTVTALGPGTVTLTPFDTEGLSFNELVVTVTEAPDYDKFIAYDEASFYGEGFDTNALGVGTDKFQAWQSWVKADGEASWAGVTMVNSAGDEGILSEGSAFAIYANGADDPEIQLWRPFVNPLSAGQAFSVALSPNFRDGSKGVKFQGCIDGTCWDRAEFYYNNDGYYYKIDNGEPVSLGWDYSATLVEVSLQMAADGSSYVLKMVRGGDIVTVADITFPGVVDCVRFYSWNGGPGDENNLVFNRMAIEQVEKPVPPAAKMEWTAGVWNPDEVGVPYTFGLKSSQDGAIGLVDLSIEPAEGVALSADQIDLSEGEATFTVTLTGETLPAGTAYTITAKAQAEGIGESYYTLTATEPYSEMRTTSGEYTFDYAVGGTIEFQIVGTPSRAGQTVALDSGNEAILVPPFPAEVVVGAIGSDDGKFVYTMVGEAEGEVWVHATKDEAEWGYAGITINGKGGSEPRIDGATIEVSFADGDGLSGKVDDTLRDQFTNVKAQVLQWNGVDAFDEVEVLNNEAEWPDMQFTPSIDNPVIRLIFEKK